MHILAVAITQVAKFGGKNLHGNITGSGSFLEEKKRNEDRCSEKREEKTVHI